MTLRIASAEIVSVFFMLVIVFSLRANSGGKSDSRRFFFAFSVSTMFGLVFDACSYIADEYHVNNVLLVIINILAFSMIDVCIVLFSLYMLSIIRVNKSASYRTIYPVVAVCALNVLGILVGVINGKFFSAKDRSLQYGPWKDVITIMPVLAVIIILVILLLNVKNLGKRNTLALGSFVAFPIHAAVIVLFFPDIALAYIAAALSCAVIYTFVRREEINEALIREQIMNMVSVMDTLTNLLNRRGYNEAIEEAKECGTLGVAFCDLNALKYTNDKFGHVAGDAYIRRFADILRDVFKEHGKICRISGDEFVVLLPDISEDTFYELKNKLDNAIRKNERIASAGYAYGAREPVMELIGRAEQEMYEDKNRYYKDTGIDRRRYELKGKS